MNHLNAEPSTMFYHFYTFGSNNVKFPQRKKRKEPFHKNAPFQPYKNVLSTVLDCCGFATFEPLD